MICGMCDVPIENGSFCKSCYGELEKRIGIKCTNCGNYGFIDPTESNIQRLEFFIPDLAENMRLCDACVIPMRGCPECYGTRN